MTETKLNKSIVYFLYLLSCASALYMFEAVQSIIMSVASLFLMLQYKSSAKWFSIQTLPFIVVFVVLLSFNLFYFNSKSLQIIANSFLLFIVPLFSSFLYESDFFKKHKEKIIFSYCICISLISIYIIIFYINDIPNHHFNWYFARFNLENKIHIHGTYISLWTGIAFLFVLDLLLNCTLHSKFKIALIVLSVLLMASLIVINTRMILYSILFLTLLNCCLFLYKTKSLNLKWIILPILLLLGIIVLLSQRYKDDLLFLSQNNITNSSRYTICYCSLKIAADSHFLGTDNSSVQPKLNDCYNQYGFQDFSKENLNSHNQYLDFFMKGGVLLFISFIATLFIKLRLSLKKKNYLYFSITLLFTFSFLTENVLVRQYGIYIFLLCDILLLGSIFTYESHSTNKIEKN